MDEGDKPPSFQEPARSDPGRLPIIERELVRTGFKLRFAERQLEREYQAGLREQSRFQNRLAIATAVTLYDIFFVSELTAIPEIFLVSAILRFVLLTPIGVLYLLLDWRGKLKSGNIIVVPALVIAPTLLACIESFWVTSPSALADYQAVPLLQLAVLTCRVSVIQTVVINVVSIVLFTSLVVTAAFVPHAVQTSMAFLDVAIGIVTLIFVWRLDSRDRQVFLFSQQAAIGRMLLASQNRALKRLTQMDALTGIGNRRCFDETLAALWHQGAVTPGLVTLILFDIDCFKQYNDNLGHQAGDECLVSLAHAVGSCLRDEHDTLARYGGEEFAVVLPNTSLEEGMAVAERIRVTVLERALPHPGGGPLTVVTVSLGVATVVAPMQPVASLIEATDRCLYQAKRQGRNCAASARMAVTEDGAERVSICPMAEPTGSESPPPA